MYHEDINPEEINEIAQRAKKWASSSEGISAMEEAMRKFDGYLAIRKRERERKPPIDIFEPFIMII